MSLLADTIPTWQSTVSVAAMLASGLTLVIGAMGVYYMKRQADTMAAAAAQPARQEIGPQPLMVELRKAMHEEFAAKAEFEKMAANNTERHGQIFQRIELVERDARAELTAQVSAINADRQRTMEKLNTELTFIRESLAAINTELKLNRTKLEHL